MKAVAERGRNCVSKHQKSLSVENEQADAGRDGQTCLARYRIFRRERGQGSIHFFCSVQLTTTSRIGNHALLIHALLKVLQTMNTHSKYIPPSNVSSRIFPTDTYI